MMRTECSISFLESQLIEIDNILQYSRFRITYNSRRKSILKKLEFQYMRSKFNEHENTVKMMSKL